MSPAGDVYDRTGVSEQQVIYRDIPLRGWIRTWYSHTGDKPWVALMALVLALALWGAWGAMILYVTLLALVMFLKFRTGTWKDIHI